MIGIFYLILELTATENSEDIILLKMLWLLVRFWVDFQADLAPRCLSRPPDQVEVDLVARHNLWKINSLIDIS